MWDILVIILCLAANALLAATELAFVAMSKGRLKHLADHGEKEAETLLSLREKPVNTLSVLQVGITFVGVIAAAVGGVGSEHWLTPILIEKWHVSDALGKALSILIFVVPYTFLSVVLGELLPKTLALRNPKWVLFNAKGWLPFLGKVIKPVVFLLEKTTKVFAKLFFPWIKDEMESEVGFTVGSILRPYMVNLAKIEKRTARDVMVPWKEVASIEKSESLEAVKQFILDTKHTRIPVVEKGKPVGLLQTKTFLEFYEKKDPNWQELILPLVITDSEEALIHALKRMQKSRSHLSIVYKNDSPVGIVTIEDILEEVVGEIYDEDDAKLP